MSRTMRAVICDGFNGPSALRVGEMPEPELPAGKVLVDIHAASVSFMDCLLVSGKYQMKPATPFVPGTDGAGIVRAVGAGEAVADDGAHGGLHVSTSGMRVVSIRAADT